jgi:hypothetical protein
MFGGIAATRKQERAMESGKQNESMAQWKRKHLKTVREKALMCAPLIWLAAKGARLFEIQMEILFSHLPNSYRASDESHSCQLGVDHPQAEKP